MCVYILYCIYVKYVRLYFKKYNLTSSLIKQNKLQIVNTCLQCVIDNIFWMKDRLWLKNGVSRASMLCDNCSLGEKLINVCQQDEVSYFMIISAVVARW